MRIVDLLSLSMLIAEGVSDSSRARLRKPKRGVDNEDTLIHRWTKMFTRKQDTAVGVELFSDELYLEGEAIPEEEMSLTTSAPTFPETTIAPAHSPSARPTLAMDTPTGVPSESPSASPSDEEPATRSPFPSHSRTSDPSVEPTSLPSIDVTSGEPSDFPTDTPSLIPTSTPTVICNMSPETREELMMTFISIVSKKEDVDDVDSPQNKAATWIIQEDRAQLCPQDDTFVQRYVMAVFYYSTGGDRWIQCRSPDDLELSNSEANEACNIASSGDTADAWLTPGSECLWGGVLCDSDQTFVEQIDFEANGVGGTLPLEIRSLQSLTNLSLERGILTGTIPSEIGLLDNLKTLDLDNNLLEGSMPSSLFSLTNLEQLDLDFNRISGTVSTLIGQLTNLTFFQINDNNISGTIPSELSRLSSLRVATLDNNRLAGAMPDEICSNILDTELTTLTSDCLGAPNRPSPPFVSCPYCISSSSKPRPVTFYNAKSTSGGKRI
eukprot:scaffold713_cov131-Cylindrotheca_fusiformis.AAC.28